MTDSNIDVQDRQLVARRISLLQRRKPVAFVLKNNAMANLQPAEQLHLIAAVARLNPHLETEDMFQLYALTLNILEKMASGKGSSLVRAVELGLKIIHQNNEQRHAYFKNGADIKKRMPLLATEAAVATFVEEKSALSAEPGVLSPILSPIQNHLAHQPGSAVREPSSHGRLVKVRNDLDLIRKPKLNKLAIVSKPEPEVEVAPETKVHIVADKMVEITPEPEPEQAAVTVISEDAIDTPSTLGPTSEQSATEQALPSKKNIKSKKSFSKEDLPNIGEIFRAAMPKRPGGRWDDIKPETPKKP